MGDALGERFFGPPDVVLRKITERQLPPAPWRYTDDTEMAISVFEILRARGAIDQDSLAVTFAHRMEDDRGYGRGAYDILTGIRRGIGWLALSHEAFEGRGSFGNGAAMRVAPLGAFFADDLERCIAEARLQSEITHAHEDAIVGAIAVAVATSLSWQHRARHLPPRDFIRAILETLPSSAMKDAIEKATEISDDLQIDQAAQVLGNGSRISAIDTVPLCLWIASRRQGQYQEAFWETVSALGDRDTTCAIVGGIIGVCTEVPQEWVHGREALPLRDRP